MQRKFQVFISSTYNDLIDERQDILKAILDLGHIPSGMEGFYATDEEQLSYIKRIIDQCDYYVLVIAGRYGSVDDEGISYTEREYDYAIEKGLIVLAFINNDVASLPSAKVDTEESSRIKLNSFKKKVAAKRLVSFWSSREQLKSGVIISLSKTVGENPRTGWVRGDAAASEDILNQLNDFRNQADVLRQKNDLLKKQLEPQLSDLVPLSNTLTIPFTYLDSTLMYDHKGQMEFSWLEIFKIVGPSLFAPQRTQKIEERMIDHIKEVKAGGIRNIELPISLMEKIRIQLSAYGLITISNHKIGPSASLEEYVAVTETGKKTLLELIAVRDKWDNQNT